MKTKQIYICAECGGRSPLWQGQCPRCKAWNTLEAEVVAARDARGGQAGPAGPAVSPVALGEIRAEEYSAVSTGVESLDAVLGQGLVPGGAILLGGEPGIGKSTLLLQLAGRLAADGRQSVYLSGEESLAQLKNRAERLGLLAGPASGLQALATTRVDDALALLSGKEPPDLLIIDSVQTLASSQAEGIPGSIGQVRAVSTELVEAAKKTRTTLVLVGHVTKEGQIAGPKLLEHMVDTVLYLEGDRRHLFRILRVLKNRFGPTDELLVFQMGGTGLEVVHDPSTFFLGARDASLSGTAVVMAMDGQRPFAVEVQALVSRSFLSIPRRTALGFDVNRLHLLLAVLEKKLRLNLGQTDIYAKIGGGLRMQEPGLDLGLVAAVLSSFYDRPLPEGAVFWGEVDLNGQIRPVAGHDTRLRQASRLGYGPILHPRGEGETRGCHTLADLQRSLFGA